MNYLRKIMGLLLVGCILMLSGQVLSSSHTINAGHETLSLPANSDFVWVMKDGYQNGLNTSIAQINVYQTFQESINYFRQQFANHGDYQEQDLGNATILSRLTAKQFITLQLSRKNFGAVAMWTVSDNRMDRLTTKLRNASLPPSFQVVNVVRKEKVETATVFSALALMPAAQRIEQALAGDGWQQLGSRTDAAGSRYSGLFRKRSRSLQVFLASAPEFGGKVYGYINAE